MAGSEYESESESESRSGFGSGFEAGAAVAAGAAPIRARKLVMEIMGAQQIEWTAHWRSLETGQCNANPYATHKMK